MLLLGSSVPAFATSANVSIELVAWNADGTAALLYTHTSIAGDTTDNYTVVGVDDQQQLAVQIAGQSVDATACEKAMAALATSIAAHKFAGITLRPDRCGADTLDAAVTTSPSITAAAKTSRIGNPGRTPRDRQIWAAFEFATGAKMPAKPLPGPDVRSAAIATKTGKLVIALLSPARGSPASTELLAFVPVKNGFAPLTLVF